MGPEPGRPLTARLPALGTHRMEDIASMFYKKGDFCVFVWDE